MRGRWARGAFAAFGMLVVSVSDARANLGQLDSSFGRTGVVHTNLGWRGAGSQARVAVEQPDGKLVTAGQGWNDGDVFSVVRYHEDGSLDTAFGDTGRVLTAFSTISIGVENDLGAFGLVLQPDGKLVAAGRAFDDRGNMVIALARYLGTDGSLDETFGIGGRVITVFPQYQYTTGLVLQPDGRLVVVGTSYDDRTDARLTRYDTDGSLDATFGMGGTTVLDLGFDEEANAIALQPDGMFVVVGGSGIFPEGVITIARVTADGALDLTFGVGGVVRDDAAHLGSAYALQTLPNGDLVVAGTERLGNHGDVAILRFHADGTPDTTFGSAGRTVTSVGPSESAYATAVVHQTDGRFMVVARVGDALALVRYTATGQTEAVTTPAPAVEFPVVISGMQQTDGLLVVVGVGGVGTPGIDDVGEDMVLRFLPDASPDPSFGIGGLVTTSAAGTRDTVEDVIVQADGKLVAVGSAWNAYRPNVAVVRYLPDGTLDASFGTGGRVLTALVELDNWAVGVVQQASGKLVVGAIAYIDGWPRFALVRYDENGRVDPTFGSGGSVITTITGNDVAVGLIQRADGTLVLAGTSSGRFALAGYHQDGALDATFGNAGTVVSTGTGPAESLLQQADGRIVVAGYGERSAAAVARYLADGSLDPTFSSDGRGPLGFSGAAYAITQQADGKLVGAGIERLARLTTAGLPDATFASTSGVATGPVWHFGIVQLADGTLVAAGDVNLEGYRRAVLTRVRTDGSMDTTFGTAGILITPTGIRDSRFQTLRLLPDSRLVAAGDDGSDFTLARYLTQPCGNGRLDIGEQCDDGAFGAGVCCDAQCRWADTGTTCDDGDACTRDGCQLGVGCVHDAGPRTDCVVPERSQLLVKQDANDQRDRLLWKWRGAPVPAGGLGDPTGTTSYGVCLYAGGTRAGAAIPAHTGWQRAGSAGFAFKSQLGTPDGIRKAALRSTAAGATGLVDGKGPSLPDLAAPSPLPLTVQLVNDETGTCVEAVYATAIRNDTRQLRAKTTR